VSLATWIIHRELPARAALARIAGSRADAIVGAPAHAEFASAPLPDVVLLGLSGDFEQELEFAHRLAPRLGDCRWILLPEPGAEAEARRLFDTLDVEVIAYPPDPRVLRRALWAVQEERRVALVSSRDRRRLLVDRFTRWFPDELLPGLLRAVDPRLVDVSLLVTGESGTGRSLLARYVHELGGSSEQLCTFLPIFCQGARSGEDLLDQIRDAEHRASTRRGRRFGRAMLWLHDAHCLPKPLQLRVSDWVRWGLPPGALSCAQLRWAAGARDIDHGLAPSLTAALAGISIPLRPLRANRQLVRRFVSKTAAAWSQERGAPSRRFTESALRTLQEYIWPGNLRELEAVVHRTLASCPTDPVSSAHLRFDVVEFWPELETYSDPSRS
jgi:DNA-binding NtrC family response regulator